MPQYHLFVFFYLYSHYKKNRFTHRAKVICFRLSTVNLSNVSSVKAASNECKQRIRKEGIKEWRIHGVVCEVHNYLLRSYFNIEGLNWSCLFAPYFLDRLLLNKCKVCRNRHTTYLRECFLYRPPAFICIMLVYFGNSFWNELLCSIHSVFR